MHRMMLAELNISLKMATASSSDTDTEKQQPSARCPLLPFHSIPSHSIPSIIPFGRCLCSACLTFLRDAGLEGSEEYDTVDLGDLVTHALADDSQQSLVVSRLHGVADGLALVET
jgi:hypothetical protein